MKYYEVGNLVLLFLLIAGMYLPYVRKIVKNKCIVRIFKLLVVVPLIAPPMYAISLALPIAYRDTSPILRLFNIVAGLSSSSIIFKFHHFYYKQKSFQELVTLWDDISQEVLHPTLRQEILVKTIKTSNRWALGFEVLFSITIFLYGLAPFYTRKLEHPIAWEYSTASPDFEILATYEFFATLYMCLVVHSYNSFLMQNVALVRGSCEYLRKSLGIIFDSLRVGVEGDITIHADDPYSKAKGSGVKHFLSYREMTYQTEADLRRWIKDHQNLIKFHNKLQEIYHVPLSIEFTVLIVVICIIAFMVITNSLSPWMTFITLSYCGTTYTIFYVTCNYGDMIGIETTNLHRNAFGNSWYVYPKHLLRNFQIIILRCNKPMNLIAFRMYPLNSSSFAKIFRHSYSFFMFLLQVINRSNSESVG